MITQSARLFFTNSSYSIYSPATFQTNLVSLYHVCTVMHVLISIIFGLHISLYHACLLVFGWYISDYIIFEYFYIIQHFRHVIRLQSMYLQVALASLHHPVVCCLNQRMHWKVLKANGHLIHWTENRLHTWSWIFTAEPQWRSWRLRLKWKKQKQFSWNTLKEKKSLIQRYDTQKFIITKQLVFMKAFEILLNNIVITEVSKYLKPFTQLLFSRKLVNHIDYWKRSLRNDYHHRK